MEHRNDFWMIGVRQTKYGVRRSPRAGRVIFPCMISTDGGNLWELGSEEYDLGDCIDNPMDKPQEEPIMRKELSYLTEMIPALTVNPGLSENLHYVLRDLMKASGGSVSHVWCPTRDKNKRDTCG